MTIKTEARHPAAFVLSEANGHRSRGNIVIAASQTIKVGQVLGQVGANEGAVAVGAPTAYAGNTGNGAVTNANPAYGAGVKEGVHRATCIEPATDAGKFSLQDPDGIEVGIVTVGVAFDGVLKFTIADGGTDFVAGDGFTWAVAIAAAADEGQYKALDLAATDGAETAAAVALYDATTGVGETATIAGLLRDADVNGNELEWPAGITADEKTAAVAQLRAAGIVVR